MSDVMYKKLMDMGKATGCHQLPERSFHYHEKQFPVCARCTGIFIGQIVGFILFVLKLNRISIITSIIFCVIMCIDGFAQLLFGIESNNIRRLITGLLCGYGFTIIVMTLFESIRPIFYS